MSLRNYLFITFLVFFLISQQVMAVVLTPTEKAFLKNHPQILLGVDPDWPPFELFDEKGIYSGLGADYIELISNELKIEMIPVRGISWSEVLTRAQNKELDLLPAAMKSEQRGKYLKFTSPYLKFPMVVITRSDAVNVSTMEDLQGIKVSVVKSYVSHEIVASNHPLIALTPYNTLSAALNALSLGQVDAFIGNLASISYAIRQLGLTNLEVAFHTPYTFQLGMGVRDDWPELVPILEKVLTGVSQTQKNEIEARWITLLPDNLVDIQNVLFISLPVLSAILAALLVMFRANRTLAKEIVEREQVERSLRLSTERLLDSQNIAHVGSWDWNLTDGSVQWSDETYRIAGVDPEHFDVNKEGFLSVVHPDDRERVTRELHENIDSGIDLQRTEMRIKRPNGDIRYAVVWGRIAHSKGVPVRFSGVIHDISEQKNTELKLHHQAYFDSLTGLPNRNYLLEQLGRSLAFAKRHHEYYALLFLDLDNFKIINDSLGHEMGDKVLQKIASRLRDTNRREDTVARLGGDEFVIILSNLGKSIDQAVQNAELIAEKIRSVLSQPMVVAKGDYSITSSIGITMFPYKGEKVSDILKFADTAMYNAKEQGRDGVIVFNQSMQQDAQERYQLLKRLRRAVTEQSFVMHYQPQYDHKHTIIGAEALVRWIDDGQIISPQKFIPLAEETGLILQIGNWVLEQACYQLSLWNRNGIKIPLVAVNVSARQFLREDLNNSITTLIQKYAIDPSWLELELTESVLIKDIELVTEKMFQLQSLGVRMSVDDFGTGYSSLKYLKRLPINKLKIDQSFTKGVNIDNNSARIVETILAMADGLGMDVIAEGVETEEELQFLLEHGCKLFQGYLFNRPMSTDDFTALINS